MVVCTISVTVCSGDCKVQMFSLETDFASPSTNETTGLEFAEALKQDAK